MSDIKQPTHWNQPGYDPSINGWHKGVIEGAPRGGYNKNYFFADSFRTYVTAFANFFRSIHVYRYDDNGVPVKDVEVPIKFGPRSKAFDFRIEKESGKKYYIPLPNITFRYTGYQFDAERASGLNETRTFYNQYFERLGVGTKMQNRFWSDIQPQPWDLTIELTLKTEYLSDADQVVQQVLAQFSPDRYFNVKEFWFCNIRRSIQVLLTGVNQDTTTDLGEDAKREITTTFTFTIKGWVYKPIEIGYIIDQINLKLETAGTTDHVWQNSLSGNIEGEEADQNSYFFDRYDFGKIYGTKVGRMSALKPESTIPQYDAATSAYFTKYKYDELPDITNYPWGSKQLYATYTVWDPDQTTYKQVTDETGTPIPEACSGYMHIPSGDQQFGFIYEVEYDKGFGEIPKDQFNEDTGEMTACATKAEPRGGTIIKAWKDLSGYGDFVTNASDWKNMSGFADLMNSTWKFDYKTVDLGTKVVSAAPIITSAGILHEDK